MAANDATARFVSVDIVWAIDGESVGPDFDYTDPIARDRYDAGLRFDVVFETTGDLGEITIDTMEDVFLRSDINGDRIDGEATFGPERAITRPDRADVEVVRTDGGFVAQYPMGLPLSPISLVDARQRAVDSGLSPDDEVIEFDDTDMQFDAARLLDFPKAPQNGRNEFVIELFGDIEFANGFALEIGEGLSRAEVLDRLVISETATVRLPASRECSAQIEGYLALLDEELDNSDEVLLDRLRAFDQIIDTQRENDCGVRDFDIPVCDAATAAVAPEALLERHLSLCPDEVEQVAATVFEPRFEDGVVRLVVPATRDGLPAYSVAMGFPAWTVETTSEGANRQKIALSVDPDTVGRFTRLDIDVSAMPESLLEERAAAVVQPLAPDAEILLADTTAIAGLPARRLIAQLEPGVFQIGTAVEIDSERLLTITGTIAGREELPVDGDGLASLLECIETSMVVVEFEPDVDPAPAGDCTSIVELSASEPTPVVLEPEVEEPVVIEPEVEPVDEPVEAAGPIVDAAASFDGSTITLVTPGSASHTVTLNAPAWALEDSEESSIRQFVELVGDGTLTFTKATIWLTNSAESFADERAVPPTDSYVVVSDDASRTVGERTLRVLTSERDLGDGRITRNARIVTPINDTRVLIVELNVWPDNDVDFDAIVATALDSLTITP